MDFLTALTTPAPTLGSLAWTFFILQILGVAAGAYLRFMHTERNIARQAFMQQLGIALMIIFGVGVLIGALRMLNVPVLNQPLWFYVQAVVELGMAGYIFYYMRSVLPGLEKAQAGRARPGQRPQARSLGTEPAAPPEPRPVATTGRREARRDKKRKNK